MTLAQIAATAGDTGFWHDVAEALAAILGGLIAWIGKSLDTKLDRAIERLNDWNQGFQTTLTEQGSAIEQHTWRLNALEGEWPHTERRRTRRSEGERPG